MESGVREPELKKGQVLVQVGNNAAIYATLE